MSAILTVIQLHTEAAEPEQNLSYFLMKLLLCGCSSCRAAVHEMQCFVQKITENKRYGIRPTYLTCRLQRLGGKSVTSPLKHSGCLWRQKQAETNLDTIWFCSQRHPIQVWHVNLCGGSWVKSMLPHSHLSCPKPAQNPPACPLCPHVRAHPWSLQHVSLFLKPRIIQVGSF